MTNWPACCKEYSGARVGRRKENRPESQSSLPVKRSTSCLDGDMSGLQNRLQQLEQPLLLVCFHADSECGEVDAPADPHRVARQASLVPGHRRVESKQEQNEKSRQQWRGALAKQADQVIYINHEAMTDVDNAAQKAAEESSRTQPVVARGPGSKVQRQTLKQLSTMMETEQTLILRPNFNVAVSLGNVQDQSGEVFACCADRQAAPQVGQSWVAGTVREDSVLRHG